MKQAALGDRLGISFQQVQKYERGQNRLSASMQKEIADIFGLPVSYFFAGLGSNLPDEQLTRAETLSLVRFYYAMPEDARGRFLQRVKAAAKLGGGAQNG
jgi:transcriptional regulator with XRE-family HTH domain